VLEGLAAAVVAEIFPDQDAPWLVAFRASANEKCKATGHASARSGRQARRTALYEQALTLASAVVLKDIDNQRLCANIMIVDVNQSTEERAIWKKNIR